MKLILVLHLRRDDLFRSFLFILRIVLAATKTTFRHSRQLGDLLSEAAEACVSASSFDGYDVARDDRSSCWRVAALLFIFCEMALCIGFAGLIAFERRICSCFREVLRHY